MPASAHGVELARETLMFSPRAIGYAKTPYTNTKEIPKGPEPKHEAEGVLEILPEFELGLTDIEGFSHLFVLWVFDRSEGFELVGTPPIDDRPHGGVAPRSPRRPNPIGLTVVELLRREGSSLHVRGLDMLDGTPILDLKPYLSSIAAETVRRGWVGGADARRAWIWQTQIDEFSKKYRVIAVDPRSQGESDKPTYGHLPETRARDYKELVDHLSLKQPVFVGWSMAGGGLSKYAEQFGTDNVGGFVLVGG